MKPITIKKWRVRGKSRWVVRYWREGGVHHAQCDTKADAEAEASRLRGEQAKAGELWLSLPGADRDALMSAYAEAARSGLDLHSLILRAKEAPEENLGPAVESVVKEIVAAKRKAGRADKYCNGLKYTLNAFARGRGQVLIGAITLKDIETHLGTVSLASWSTVRTRLSSLFKFAIRRGYCVANPCARLEPVTVTKAPPRVFTPGEAEKCLTFLEQPQKLSKHSRIVSYRYALPWFVLTTFCGLRPEEADKTRRRDIHAKEGWIKVEAQTTKIRQRRVVYPLPCAIALLEGVLRKGRLPISPQARNRVQHRLRAHLGWRVWPKDITRHSAASYWLSVCKSAGEVADNLGHSEKTLRRNYKALVTRADAERFWAVAESRCVKPANVVQMPTEAAG